MAKIKNNETNQIKKQEIDQYDYIDVENEPKIVEKYAKSIGQFLIHFNNSDHEVN